MPLSGPVLILAPTIVRVTYKMHYTGGRSCDCVMDISLDETGTSREAAVNELVPLLAQPWQDNVLYVLCDNVTFDGIHVIDLDSLDGVTADSGPHSGSPTAGAVSAGQASPQVAYLVHKNTTSGRGTRPGRTYLPGVSEADVNEDGTVITARKDIINTKMGAYKTAIAALTSFLGFTSVALRVVHVHKGDKENPATWTWNSTDISSFTCDPTVATQRRRLR